jgi:hypothetical protein
MIFMPFPRFVVPTSAPPPFAITKVASMKAFLFIDCTSVAKFVGDIRQHSTQNFIAAPSLKAPMYGFVVRIALRQQPVLRSTAPLQGHDAWKPAFDQDAHPQCFLPDNDSGCVPTARP